MTGRLRTEDPAVLERLQRLVERVASRAKFGHAVLAVGRADGSFRWSGAAGTANAGGDPMTTATPFPIASVTKLFIAALVLQLHEEGVLDLYAPIATYLGAERVAGLHTIGGTDHTPELTPFHLLSHTSGLNDYLEGRSGGGRSLYGEFSHGTDLSWDFDDVLDITRSQRHHFPPQDPNSERRKGRYSDTDFQLLIAIVEAVTGGGFAEVLERRIFRPLDLRQTWLPGKSKPLDPAPAPAEVWSKGRPLVIPGVMASANDLISRSDDLLRFIGALIGGELFIDAATYPMMEQRRNRVIWPYIHYGLGMMHFKIGALNAPGRRAVHLVGHSGSTGSWLFHCPELDVLTAGTVDEMTARAFPFRFIPRVLRAVVG